MSLRPAEAVVMPRQKKEEKTIQSVLCHQENGPTMKNAIRGKNICCHYRKDCTYEI